MDGCFVLLPAPLRFSYRTFKRFLIWYGFAGSCESAYADVMCLWTRKFTYLPVHHQLVGVFCHYFAFRRFFAYPLRLNVHLTIFAPDSIGVRLTRIVWVCMAQSRRLRFSLWSAVASNRKQWAAIMLWVQSARGLVASLLSRFVLPMGYPRQVLSNLETIFVWLAASGDFIMSAMFSSSHLHSGYLCSNTPLS